MMQNKEDMQQEETKDINIFQELMTDIGSLPKDGVKEVAIYVQGYMAGKAGRAV